MTTEQTQPNSEPLVNITVKQYDEYLRLRVVYLSIKAIVDRMAIYEHNQEGVQ